MATVSAIWFWPTLFGRMLICVPTGTYSSEPTFCPPTVPLETFCTPELTGVFSADVMATSRLLMVRTLGYCTRELSRSSMKACNATDTSLVLRTAENGVAVVKLVVLRAVLMMELPSSVLLWLFVEL